jgi:hypothetical protein
MLVVRRRPREALVLAVAAMAFIVPWQLWVSAYQNEIPHAFVGKYGAYGPWLGEAYREGGLPFVRAVLAKNANSLFGLFGYITLPVSSVLPRLVSLGTVLGVIGLGAWSAWRRIPVTLAFMVIYAGVVLLWPFEPMRFTLVVWPVLAGLFAAGTRTIWAWRPRGLTLTTVRAAGIAAILLVAVGYGWYNARGVHGKWWVNIQSDAGKRSKPIAEWVTRTTQPDEIVVTDDDLIVYLYTGRRALPTTTFGPRSYVTPLTARQDADILRTLLTRYRPRWYIAAGSQSVASAQFLMNNPPAPLRYAGSISTARIYEPVLK